MNFKKPVFRLTRKLLLMAFMAWLISNPFIFSVELEKYNPEKATACEKLVQKMTRPEEVRFFVSYDLHVWLSDATIIRNRSPKIVFFSPSAVDDENFLEIAAHELGHIEYKTANQVTADFFAMKLVGKEGVMNYRKRNYSPPYYLHAISTCYESNGKNCPDVSDFSISYTVNQFFRSFLN